jgi:hypothetical protein
MARLPNPELPNPELTRSVLFRMRRLLTVAAITVLAIRASSTGQEGGSHGVSALRPTATDGVDPINSWVEVVEHNGRRAVRLARLAATRQASSTPAILPSGTIEIAVAGSTRAGTEEYGLLPRRRLSREGPRPKDREVLPAADQRQSERPGAAQPCRAIRFQDGVLWERLRNEHP